jgi:chemotaxis protein methyltransferase CheR
LPTDPEYPLSPRRPREEPGSESGISPSDFQRLSQFISDHWGINLPPTKKALLEGRIRKRLKALGLDSFKKYCDYLFSPEGLEAEPMEMVDLITTNKTDFFREPDHFESLTHRLLPLIFREHAHLNGISLKLWSAGCSTGEEPYTLAMVLQEFAEQTPGFQFSLLASDISRRVLEIARLGVYAEEKIAPVPLAMRKKYLWRSKDPEKRQVRIDADLRKKICWTRLNLLDLPASLPKPFHVIFCRNVLIYFDRPTQERIISSFLDCLTPKGFLILGHSENLAQKNFPLATLAPTIYRKTF